MLIVLDISRIRRCIVISADIFVVKRCLVVLLPCLYTAWLGGISVSNLCQIAKIFLNVDREDWPSGLKRCNQNRKVPGSNPLGAQPGLGTQPRCKAPSDPWVKNVNALIKHRVSEAVPSIMTPSWPCGSQIAVKKISWSYIFNQPFRFAWLLNCCHYTLIDFIWVFSSSYYFVINCCNFFCFLFHFRFYFNNVSSNTFAL